MCDQVLPLMNRMIVDKEGEMVRTKCKRGMCVKSDRNILKLEINLTFTQEKTMVKSKCSN